MLTAALLICLSPIATDGDTARCGPSRLSVRLYGVLSVDGSDEDAVAKQAITALAVGGWRCTPAPTGPVTSYNRLVTVCFTGAGVDVGQQLIRTGKAKEACSFTQTRAYPRGYYGTCSVAGRRVSK